MFVGYWPNVKEGKEKDFADKFNAMPKIVFSKKLEKAPWGKWSAATIVRNSPSETVAKLKREGGKDIVMFGSVSIAQALMVDGLIDEYRLVMCPVVLGSGRALFADKRGPVNVKLLSAKPLDRGGVLLNYGKDGA
jgi:dihydrofolate reductase